MFSDVVYLSAGILTGFWRVENKILPRHQVHRKLIDSLLSAPRENWLQAQWPFYKIQ